MPASNLPTKLVVLFLFFLLGSSLIPGCSSKKIAPTFHAEDTRSPASPFVVNINTADISELERLPHVGPVLAKKIIEHRQRYGPFRKVEHLLIVEGVSEKRFMEFRDFISTE
jgi:competence protein ComEA